MSEKELKKLLTLLEKFGEKYDIETADLIGDIEDILNKEELEDEETILDFA